MNENGRRKLHKESLRILSKYDYTEEQATKFLENEIEKLIKRKPKKLNKGEVYCGLCRIKIKTKDFKKHGQTEVHKYIGQEIIKLHTLGMKIKLDIMRNKRQDLVIQKDVEGE